MGDTKEQAASEFEASLARMGSSFEGALAACTDEPSLRAANARYTGPSGELTALYKLMPQLPGERRKELGKRANELKEAIERAFGARLDALSRAARTADLESAPIDPSLPGRGMPRGGLHPITRTRDEILDVLTSIGFEAVESPEIDTAERNFTRLGFPPDHPATDMQDSFFVAGSEGRPFDEKLLLRTHTSNAQVHELLARREIPIQVACAGTVYRRDDDATHSPMFQQIEGFWVDRGITFAHLKGVLTLFVRRLFGADVPVRFRPSYFPFVEPGGELDMGCAFCKPWDGAGSDAQRERTRACRVCKASGWMEILGCGMIHPVVFDACGWPPSRRGSGAEAITGFAFGMGIDRIAMLRQGIGNIRLLYENDIRFLSQV